MTSSPNAQPVRHKNGARPYARKRKFGPSVTTVLNAMGKGDGLIFGATKEAATFAVLHRDEWMQMEDKEAIDRIRTHHAGVWSGRAAVGTLVHSVNEAWTWGTDVDLLWEAQQICEGSRPPKVYVDNPAQLATDAEAYLDGLEKFWRACNPQTISTEEVVYCDDKTYPWIGQRDWVAKLGDETWLLDIKTTARERKSDQFDSADDIYPDSFRLQLAAYRHAPLLLRFFEGEEVDRRPNYPVDRTGILDIRGDGSYRLWELSADEAEYQTFLNLRRLYDWTSKDCKKPPPRPVYSEELKTDDPFEGIAS